MYLRGLMFTDAPCTESEVIEGLVHGCCRDSFMTVTTMLVMPNAGIFLYRMHDIYTHTHTLKLTVYKGENWGEGPVLTSSPLLQMEQNQMSHLLALPSLPWLPQSCPCPRTLY